MNCSTPGHPVHHQLPESTQSVLPALVQFLLLPLHSPNCTPRSISNMHPNSHLPTFILLCQSPGMFSILPPQPPLFSSLEVPVNISMCNLKTTHSINSIISPRMNLPCSMIPLLVFFTYLPSVNLCLDGTLGITRYFQITHLI